MDAGSRETSCQPTAHLDTMETPVADAFAARLAELQQQDRESQQRTQATLQRLRGLIAQLEAIELD